jgi:hypothetical protein
LLTGSATQAEPFHQRTPLRSARETAEWEIAHFFKK